MDDSTTRRNFLTAAAASAALPVLTPFVRAGAFQGPDDAAVGFAVRKVKPLPYEELPKFLSKAQLTAHHTAHYGGALKSLVEIEGKLETADRKAANANYSEYRELRREQLLTMNSVLLHELYFDNLAGTLGVPGDRLRKALEARFGSLDKWREDFTACAVACRGWAILAYHGADKKLYNVVSDAHDVGLLWMGTPLLVADLYEHAYYVDYQNKKQPYIEGLMEHVGWSEVDRRFANAQR
jgi:Fe-Mn family superoxide dismutase